MVAYRSHSYVQSTGDVSYIDVAKPSGLANNDLLLLFLLESETTDHPTYQAGFKYLGHSGGEAHHPYLMAWYKVVTNASAEPANYRIYSETGDTETLTVVLAAYNGVNTTYPIVKWSRYTSEEDKTYHTKVSDVAVRKNGSSVVCVATDRATNWATPTGFTERRDTSDADGSIAFFDRTTAYANNGYSGHIHFDSTNFVHQREIHVSINNGNQAPNAPTLTSPVGNPTLDRTLMQRFTWTFSDPDTSDTQSAYQLRYKLTSSSTWNELTTVQTPSSIHDFAASTFTAAAWEWQVRCTDQAAALGPYSASAYFTAANATVGPTITYPSVGAYVDEYITVTWSVTNQDSYQLRTVADNGGVPNESTVYTDTGEIAAATPRAHDATFAVNNRTEHIQVRVKYNSLWSVWTSVRVNVQFTPPATPTFELVPQLEEGALDVQITNPTPGGGQPTVLYNEVWVDDGDADGLTRHATTEAINSTWRYYTPISGRDYTPITIRVLAVGSNGTNAWSE